MAGRGERTRDRLRRLRREVPAEAGPGPLDADVVPDGEATTAGHDPARQQRLERLRSRLASRGAAVEAHRPGSPPSPACSWPLEVGPPRELEEVSTPFGSAWVRRTQHAPEHRHGELALDQCRHSGGEVWSLLTGDESLRDLDPGQVVFLDTETTGLAGGVGTTVWMVGLGSYEPDGSFLVWQAYLPGPEAERAFLHIVHERLMGSAGVVSFFGRSYDQHRLLDRFGVHGFASPFKDRPHLDLFAPLRRLVRGAYEDHRLQTLERELCGHERADDLPGSMAPEAWFSAVAGRPHRVEGVFKHNLEDVLSLLTLHAVGASAQRTQLPGGQPLRGCGDRRRLGLGQALLERGRPVEALHALGERPVDPSLAWDWTHLQAEALCRDCPDEATLSRLEESLGGEVPTDPRAGRAFLEVVLRATRLALRLGEGERASAAMAALGHPALDLTRCPPGRLRVRDELAQRVSRT